MKVYHSYEKSKGFDLNKMDFNRGIFTLPEDVFVWAANRYGKDSPHANPFSPNEFGDTVVELEIDPKISKVYTVGDQGDAVQDLIKDENVKQTLMRWLEGDMGQMNVRKAWHVIDRAIGTILKRKGYDLMHHTDDQMYGDVWVILNKNAIKGIKFSPK
jgi:hypothetical protein